MLQSTNSTIAEKRPIRTKKVNKKESAEILAKNPLLATRELCNRNFYFFLQEFWNNISSDEFKPNWHIEYICSELQEIAEGVAENKPKKYDLIINVPPGTTKTTICSIMFPAWCWTRWPWMRFIATSYSSALSLESAGYSRDLIRSEYFKQVYPEFEIKQDKDSRSNFRILRKLYDLSEKYPNIHLGGNRYSTSTGGTLTGFHAHIFIIDDPLDPNRAASERETENANNWLDQTASTRKVDKAITPTILIMQRLHENDPTGHIFNKKKENIKHICLPGEIKNYKDKLKPKELKKYYKNDLLDPDRLSWSVLKDLEVDLGQYGYAGQIGQDPAPPAGGMFKVDHLQVIQQMPQSVNIVQTIRYWDKAGTEGGSGAFTVGVKMHKLKSGKYLISDIKRGRWSTDQREKIMRETAEVDGKSTIIYFEQEPGSGGKESAEGTIRNLAGYSAHTDRPTGDKIYRADPFSVQVNNGNVLLLQAAWNQDFIDEFRFFPYGTYKDQVDAGGGAFNKLAAKRQARTLTR